MSTIAVWNTIRQKVEGSQNLHGVYDYQMGKSDGYPYATVTLAEGESEFGDSAGSFSARNIERNSFIIRVYQEQEPELFGAEKAERIAMEVLEELKTAFHQDTTLSGTVKWQRPVSWALGYEIVDKIVKTVELTIETMSVVNSK